MKMNQTLPLLLILASCGNPHLISKGKPITHLPLVIDTPSISADFNLLKVETLAGENELYTKINDTSKSNSEIINVTNQDPQEMEISYQLLDGTHFKFNGGSFPGLNGSCSANLESAKTCTVDLYFESEDEGVFQDKLIVIFKPKGSSLPTKIIEFPLKGERKNSIVASPLLKVRTQNGDENLNFGKTENDQKISSKLILSNIGNIDLNIDSQFEKNSSFTFTGDAFPGTDGTCESTLAVDESCILDITFTESTTGLYSDNLLTSYSVNQTSAKSVKQLIKTSIFGEKTKKSGTPGNLVPSEILGDKVDFGEVSVGSVNAKQVELSNIGQTAVQITKVNFTGNSEFTFNGGVFPGTRGTCSDIVQPGNCLIDIVYKPTNAAKHAGELVITTDNKELMLHLSGKAKANSVCYEENEILLSAVTKAKAEKPVLPYLTSSKSTDSKLQVLYGTEVNGYYKTLDMYTVKNSMVYVQYHLPELIDEVTSINFGVEVQKIVLDNYKDTESLCLSTSSNVRKCSGRQFELDSWQKLINTKFWDKYKAPVSELYTEQFDQSSWSCGNTSCMRLKMVYNLESIFELSSSEMQKVVKDNKVSLIFSDDTRLLKLPKLLIKTRKQVECK